MFYVPSHRMMGLALLRRTLVLLVQNSAKRNLYN